MNFSGTGFKRWKQGNVRLEIQTENPERFINLCTYMDIRLFDIVYYEHKVYAGILIKDFYRLKVVVRRTKARIKIIKRTGLPFILKTVSCNKGHIIGVALFILINAVFSNYIWKLEFEGGFIHTDVELKKYVSEYGIRPGMAVKEVDCQKIEDMLREKYEDVAWVSARLYGTSLYIKLNESVMPIMPEKQEGRFDYVASRDGMVREIVVRSGTPKVHVGDEVKKGDILISGEIDIVDDAGNIKKEYVAPEGEVVIEAEYYIMITVEYPYIQRIYTGKSVKGLELYGKDRKIFSLISGNSYINYDIIAQDVKIPVLDMFGLEIYVRKLEKREYTCEDRIFTYDEAKQKAESELEKVFSKMKQDKIEIICADNEYTDMQDYLMVKCMVHTKGEFYTRCDVQ